MDLLKQYASVHYQFARVAYVTFAANASVDYDDITARKRPFDKCQMFPSVQQDRYHPYILICDYVSESPLCREESRLERDKTMNQFKWLLSFSMETYKSFGVKSLTVFLWIRWNTRVKKRYPLKESMTPSRRPTRFSRLEKSGERNRWFNHLNKMFNNFHFLHF